ncbi:MAG TPA: type II secretion system protein [Phycisphaerae bacterium]|nr:type II secretion system protein [Phycisphaerae bacterium]
MRRTKAFTLIELLVVVGIIALLIAILMPGLGRARELTRQVICGTNLNAAGKAIAMYRASNDDLYPCLNDTAASYVQGSPAGGAAAPADLVTATGMCNLDNLSLLLVKGDISWSAFLCPSTTNKLVDRTDDTKYGFLPGSVYTIDFGLHLGADKSGAATFSKLDPGFIIMGDADVGDQKMALVTDVSGNETTLWNHKDDGVNLLSNNGDVRWVKPNANRFIVVNGDNVYTNGGAADDAGASDTDPTTKTDQVLYSPKDGTN